MSDVQEQALIAQARQGSREAFGTLVERYQQRILSLTNRICSNPADGEEAAQEAFLSAYEGLPSFRGESSFSTWLYRLAANACFDLLRREGRRSAHTGPSLDDPDSAVDLPDSGPSPEALAERAELREEIEAALRILSPDHRSILILRELHQLSYEEIARVLSLEPGTVKSRLNRARRSMRKILRKSGNISAAAPSKEAGEEGCP